VFDRPRFDRLRFDRLRNEWRRLVRLRPDRLKLDRLKLDRLKLERLKLDQLKWDRLKLDRLKLDRLKVDGLPLDRLREERARLEGAIGTHLLGERNLTRRRLLTAVPGAAGALLLAGAATPVPPSPRAVAAPRPRKPHPVEKAAVAPRPLPVQHRPVFTLADYRRVVPVGPFPADAVALTIDDGPHPVWTPKILRLLDKYHVPALFCMIGNQVLGHETVARDVTRDGHQLANHTWSHPSSLAHNTPAQIHKEILKAQHKIHDTTGYVPKLFRSPGGAWSPAVLGEAARAGLVPLDWSDDPRDWSRPGTAAITHRLLAAEPGQILLCHDGGGDRSETYAALRTVIPALTARGYRFVAL
jgi:peptidoglycan/xylan/chitin deacetylase (PgdA/CDA1 family)